MEFDSVITGFRRLAVVPRFERDEEERAVGSLYAAKQAVSQDRTHVLDAGRVHDDFLDLPGRLRRTLQRGRVRQLKGRENVSLIFIRQEAAGNFRAEEAGAHAQNAQQDKGEPGFVDQVTTGADVSVSGSCRTPD